MTEKTAPRYFVETFGCQMNVNDSEKVAGLLQGAGYSETGSADDADFVFVNTCAVREKASEKLFHTLARLRHLKRSRPELKVGVGGCVAQLEGKAILERARGVDVLVGTHTLARVPELLAEARATQQTAVDLDRKADPFTVPVPTVAHTSPVRAYVTAIEGCNHVCSFCVVPRTRGPEVYRPLDAIVAEVRDLVGRGYPEVMLLGQTVNAWTDGARLFPELLAHVGAVPGLKRLRFTTSHPEHVDEAFARAMAGPLVCPYLHLPVQSGSDAILADMRRGYTRAEYVERAALLRRHVPGLALSSDVIVGYPGESVSDFAATISLVDEVGFDGLFVFAYSPRPGTTAFRRVDDVPADEKMRRLKLLNARQQQAQEVANRAYVGTVQEVLVDEITEGRVAGRNGRFRLVHCDGPADLLGRMIQVEITGSGPNALTGVRRD